MKPFVTRKRAFAILVSAALLGLLAFGAFAVEAPIGRELLLAIVLPLGVLAVMLI